MKNQNKNFGIKIAFLVVLVCVILFIGHFVNFFYEYKKGSKYAKEIKAKTDQFLELFVERRYDILFHRYMINSSMDKKEFFEKMILFNKNFSEIDSFKYVRHSCSSDKGEYIAFVLYYDLFINTGKEVNCTFSVGINEHLNKPDSSKVFLFYVYNPVDEKNDFIIRLIDD